MNTLANKILNALSFANVSNLGEFHALLRQLDAPDRSPPARETARHKVAAPGPEAAPVHGYIQGAV
ncbi:MAG: hypothetical protein KJ889_14380 [Gammaproteobacteria bacterium]|nr:hypothetical protein [Gammaproteobacteria bacterium]